MLAEPHHNCMLEMHARLFDELWKTHVVAKPSWSNLLFILLGSVLTYCCGNQTPPIAWNSCNISTMDPCRSDYKEWLLYKEWYLNRKLKYYTLAMKQTLPACDNCYIPSGPGSDPGGFINCIAPPISDFSVAEVPNSSADGIKRIIVKYKDGNEFVNWPLLVTIQMNGGMSLTQDIVFTPGFGSQEMMVQDMFTSFSISAVVCTQLTGRMAQQKTGDGGKTGNPHKNGIGNIINGGGVDWVCPTINDFTITTSGNTYELCFYGSIPFNSNHSVLVYVDVVLQTPFGNMEVLEEIPFCYLDRAPYPMCKTRTFNYPVVSATIRDLACDLYDCGFGNWECPDIRSFDKVFDPQIGGSNVGVCYTGPAIPPGKKIIVQLVLHTPCGDIPFTVTFCPETSTCQSQFFTTAELCGADGNYLEIVNVECVDGSCGEWTCPATDANFDFDPIFNNTTQTWDLRVCYTGYIPPGKVIYIHVIADNFGCGYSVDFMATVCSTQPCFIFNTSASATCSDVWNFSFKGIDCKDEPCSGGGGSGACIPPSEFTAAVDESGPCNSNIPGLYGINIRVTHTGGPVILTPPVQRVKVKVEITTYSNITQKQYKHYRYVWFSNGENFKDPCYLSRLTGHLYRR